MATKRVLLVDDEPDLLELMSQHIELWGYDVVRASNGKDAIEAVKNKEADIVILDYMMPAMNGIETLENIRNINRDIPVIMFTAYPDEKSIKSVDKLGISAYIPKLSTYTDVKATLESALDMVAKKLDRKE